MDISIRIAGEAGQGLQSVGNALTEAFAETGLHIFAGKSYMSRIRGGLNWVDLRIADHELFGLKESPDMLLALNETALDVLIGHTAPGAMAILDSAVEKTSAVAIDFTGLAEQSGGSKVMSNTVAAGTVFGILRYPLEKLENYIRKAFAGRDEIISKNLACASAGYSKGLSLQFNLPIPQPSQAPAYVTDGASMTGLSAAVSGVKFVAAYPMTPGTATFTWLAKASDKYGIVVEQAEDEIAAINMACGAVYAGVPAMTTTSGGGFALMCEGLALAGMLELPIFIVIAQRPGPATGMPTRTAQEDLKFAVNAGHGEFSRLVYAPGTNRQCFELTRVALENAHRFQIPSIMLTDQYLQDAEKNITMPDTAYSPIDRHLLEGSPEGYVRYADTPDGISPRAVPGNGAQVVADSDEHGEDGHLTEDFGLRIKMQNKRMRKHALLPDVFIMPEVYGKPDCDVAVVCWGSSYGACREYVDMMNANGKGQFAMIHFPQVWPLPGDRLKPLLDKPRRMIVVESNCTGQFRSLLRDAGISRKTEGVSRYDGLPITCEYLAAEVKI